MLVYGILVLVSFSINIFVNVILPQSKQRRKFILSSHYGDFFICLFPLLVICERLHYTSVDKFVKQVDVEAKRIVSKLHVGINIK